MKEFLKKMFSSQGDVSWMRVMSTFVILDVIIQWNITCLAKMKFEDIPINAAGLVGGILVAKVAQTFGERNSKNGC